MLAGYQGFFPVLFLNSNEHPVDTKWRCAQLLNIDPKLRQTNGN